MKNFINLSIKNKYKQEIKDSHVLNADIKKQTLLNDINNHIDGIRFGCGGLPIESLVKLFVGIIIAIGMILGPLISLGIIGKFSMSYFLIPLFGGLIFAYIVYRRGISCIQVYTNSIVIKKYKNIIYTTKYELFPGEVEYVNIEKLILTYNVLFKIKGTEEKIVINNIEDGENLKEYLNAIGIVTL